MVEKAYDPMRSTIHNKIVHVVVEVSNLPRPAAIPSLSHPTADLDEEGGSELRAKIHINLGITLEVQGLLIAACEQYREAFLLSPRMCSAIKLLGSALYELVGRNFYSLLALFPWPCFCLLGRVDGSGTGQDSCLRAVIAIGTEWNPRPECASFFNPELK